MKLSMSADFRLLKKVTGGDYVPVASDEIENLDVGGYCFRVGDIKVPFDWSAYECRWADNDAYLNACTGYGWVNDFELDDYFDEEFEKLGITRDDVSAKFLASVNHIEEFFVSFDVETLDGYAEGSVGDNTDKNSVYKLELLRVSFEDIDTGNLYEVNPCVLMAFNAGEKIVVRGLGYDDREDVEQLDGLSSCYVSQWLQEEGCDEDYGYGIFKNNELIGYCSIGYADDCGNEIESYPGYCDESLYLSDVYIKPEYRGCGYAILMVNEAIKKRSENEKELVFLKPTASCKLYENCGFELIGDGFMVRDERVKSLDNTLSKATQTCEEMNKGVAEKGTVDIVKE